METDNFQVFNNVAMTANRISSVMNANQYALGGVQAVWTGSPVGIITIETSNDVGQQQPDGTVTGVTNWDPYEGSPHATGGSAGSWSWHIWAWPFKWVRLTYTFTSGSGTLNARINEKG